MKCEYNPKVFPSRNRYDVSVCAYDLEESGLDLRDHVALTILSSLIATYGRQDSYSLVDIAFQEAEKFLIHRKNIIYKNE